MDFLNRKRLLPYKLQTFAEDPAPASDPIPTPDPAPANEPAPSNEPQLTAEEQLAKLTAENKKYKSAMDKAASDAADWKKKYRATLDEKERLDQEKVDRDAQFQSEFDQLKRENSINKMSKSFIAMGYTEEQALKASEAQIDGDTDELFRIQQAFLIARDKTKEAEWMKSLPTPPSGNKDTVDDAFIKGFDKG